MGSVQKSFVFSTIERAMKKITFIGFIVPWIPYRLYFWQLKLDNENSRCAHLLVSLVNFGFRGQYLGKLPTLEQFPKNVTTT